MASPNVPSVEPASAPPPALGLLLAHAADAAVHLLAAAEGLEGAGGRMAARVRSSVNDCAAQVTATRALVRAAKARVLWCAKRRHRSWSSGGRCRSPSGVCGAVGVLVCGCVSVPQPTPCLCAASSDDIPSTD